MKLIVLYFLILTSGTLVLNEDINQDDLNEDLYFDQADQKEHHPEEIDLKNHVDQDQLVAEESHNKNPIMDHFNSKVEDEDIIDENYEDFEEAINEDLNTYRKLSINDLVVSLQDFDDQEDVDNPNEFQEIIKAYHKDDLQFECDLPEEYKGTYDWSVNGYLIGLNDASYSLILDKVDSNTTFLNVSCHFQPSDMKQNKITLNFPPINLGIYEYSLKKIFCKFS